MIRDIRTTGTYITSTPEDFIKLELLSYYFDLAFHYDRFKSKGSSLHLARFISKAEALWNMIATFVEKLKQDQIEEFAQLRQKIKNINSFEDMEYVISEFGRFLNAIGLYEIGKYKRASLEDAREE